MTTSQPSETLVADCLLGRYELLMPVATGGMAVVWAARLKGSRGFTKIVAIKTIRPELAEDPQFEHMLFDEASLASRVRHPHVVEIMDLGDERGIPYIVMEWIDGEPLHVIIKAAAKAGGIPLPVAARIVSQACAGLHAAHELRDDTGALVGLVHRDISPQNVLVTWEGVAKVVDFGVAKAVGRASEDTRAGQVKGKIGYLAPEQARGGTVDRRTDVFALGILLFMLTTGKHPYRAPTEFKTLAALCSPEPLPRVGKLIPGFPPTLERVIAQALEKEPDKRFQTANELLRALDHALPANKRISTDEEVADFLRPLLGQHFEWRRVRLKEAQRLSDERAAGRDAGPGFTAEAVEMMMDERGSMPSLSGIQATADKESGMEALLGAGLGPTERAAAARAVAAIVARLRRTPPTNSGIVPAGPPVSDQQPGSERQAAEPSPATGSSDDPVIETREETYEEAVPAESEPVQRPAPEANPEPTESSVPAASGFSLAGLLQQKTTLAHWKMAGVSSLVLLIAAMSVVAVTRAQRARTLQVPPAVSAPVFVPEPPASAAPGMEPTSSAVESAPASSAFDAGAPRGPAPEVVRPKPRKHNYIPKGI